MKADTAAFPKRGRQYFIIVLDRRPTKAKVKPGPTMAERSTVCRNFFFKVTFGRNPKVEFDVRSYTNWMQQYHDGVLKADDSFTSN